MNTQDPLLISIDVEQNVLGCLLAYNHVYTKLAAMLQPHHFSVASHQRIFSVLIEMIAAGQVCNAVTASQFFASDRELQDVGGKGYIASLEVNAVNVHCVDDYAQMLVDLWQRREAVRIAEELKLNAWDFKRDISAAEIVASASAMLSSVGVSSARSKTAAELVDEITADASGQSKVTPTGMRRLDRALAGGLHAGRMYAIAAKMKYGKTAMLGSIAYQTAIAGSRVLYICLEMSGKEIMARIMARHVGVNALAFLNGWDTKIPPEVMAQKYYNAKTELTPDRFPLSFDDAPGMDLNALIAKISEAGISKKYDGIIVDYIQLVSGAQKGESEASFSARVAQRMAEAIKRYPNLWLLTAAQINRDGDVRGSDGLRMACDLLFKLCKTEDDSPEAWLEMLASRYTPYLDVGSEVSPAYLLNRSVGPYYEET